MAENKITGYEGPDIDVSLLFKESLENLKLFGEAVEELDDGFGNLEKRIDFLQSFFLGTNRNMPVPTERNIHDTNGITALQGFETGFGLKKSYNVLSNPYSQRILDNSLQNHDVSQKRANIAVYLELTRALEELTKEISSNNSITTDLANKLSANSALLTEIGNNVSSAGDGSGIGSDVIKVVKEVLGNSGFQDEVRKYRSRENLLGRDDYIRGRLSFRGQTVSTEQVGTLEALRGVVNNDIIDRNTTNNSIFDMALRNETLAPYMNELASMNSGQMNHLRGFIKQTREPVNDLADLLYAMKESRDWQPVRRTVEEKHGSAIGKLNNRDMANALTDNFSQRLLRDISDRDSFRRISTSGTTTGSVMNSLSTMSDSEFSGFTRHLQGYTSSNGQIRNMNQLSEAMGGFQRIQSRNRDSIRRSNSSYTGMRSSLNSITGAINSSGLTRGMGNMTGFLQSIPSLASAATSALGGLAGGIATMGLSMVAEKLINVAVEDVVYNATTTKSQKKVDAAQRQVDRYTKRFSNSLDLYTSNDYGAMFLDTAGLLWNSIADLFTRGDTKVGYFETLGDATKFKNFKDTHDTRGMTDEEIIDAYLEESGIKGDLEQAQADKFERDYNKQIESAGFQDLLTQYAAKSHRDSVENGVGELEYSDITPNMVMDRIQENTKEISVGSQNQQLQLLLDGYSKNSDEYFEIRKKQLTQMKEIYDDELSRVEEFTKGLREEIENMPDSEKYELDEDGNLVKSWELKKKEMQLEVMEDRLGKEYAQYEANSKQIQVQLIQEAFRHEVSKINKEVSKIQQQSQLQATMNSIKYDRQSSDYYEKAIENLIEKIDEIQQERDSLATYNAEGMNEEDKIQELAKLDQTIANNELQLKDLKIANALSYRSDLNNFLEDQSVEYLRQRVETGAYEDSPLLRNLRINQANDRIAEFKEQISKLEDKLVNASEEEARQIQSEIRDLTKQSLQTQLGILDEMRGPAGTFNLPEGVREMTYFEHMTRNNTHQSYSVQGGDVIVNLTLPNVTGNTTRAQMEALAAGLGQGLYRSNDPRSIRNQMRGNPGYHYQSY